MGDLLARMLKSQERVKAQDSARRAAARAASREERGARQKFTQEVDEQEAVELVFVPAGCPFSLALHVARRDMWRCRCCGRQGRLAVVDSGKGRRNEPRSTVLVCEACRDDAGSVVQ